MIEMTGEEKTKMIGKQEASLANFGKFYHYIEIRYSEFWLYYIAVVGYNHVASPVKKGTWKEIWEEIVKTTFSFFYEKVWLF